MDAIVGVAVEQALEEERTKNAKEKEEEDTVKHNLFADNDTQRANVLSHEDGMEIIALAKESSVGSLRTAMKIYAQNNPDVLAHGWDSAWRCLRLGLAFRVVYIPQSGLLAQIISLR